MRLSEMNDSQRRIRRRVMDALDAAGWASMNNDELFEKDYWYEPEAGYEYLGDDYRFEFGYQAEEGSFAIDIGTETGGVSLKVFADDEQLSALLALIVEAAKQCPDVEAVTWQIVGASTRAMVYVEDEDDWRELESQPAAAS
ncbi:hypothetical protein [Haliangium sp.]|uniref:hypothetical protein n=1 Tax=Haliangium sp. TaxID=2663208 RepID=UPI003D11FC9A